MKITVAGEGGQGVQVIAEILAKAAFLDNKSSLYIPNFGVEQRGGVSLGFIVIDDKEVVYPKFEKTDILAVFCDRAIERTKRYISPGTKIILGPAVKSKKISGIRLKTALATKVWNMVILGKIISLQDLVSQESVEKAIEERFARWFAKQPSLRELDFKALAEGLKQ